MKDKKYESEYELVDIEYEDGTTETFVIDVGRIKYYGGMVRNTCEVFENSFICGENIEAI